GDPTNEGSRAIESTFAEVMVHQVAMLNGVMRGVRSLLAKLAPASIEAEISNPRRRAASGMQLGPFRYKTLWELYIEIYGDFAEDEKQAFMLIFGPEFVHAYTELAGEPAVAAPGGPPAPHAFGAPQQHPQPQPPPAFPQPGARNASHPAFPAAQGQLQQPPLVNQPMVTHPPQHPGQPAPPPMVSQPGPWPPPAGGSWPGGGPTRR
ncbi:MAG: type VI secretion system-associated FHA domain protein, partial [Polyangiaceae bacterium]